MPNPVIFLPGYYGSKLQHVRSGTEIWLNGKSLVNANNTLSALRLDPNDPNALVPTGVLDEIAILPPFIDPDAYKGVLRFLRTNIKAETLAFHYDWRKSLDSEADRLHGQVQRLVGTSPGQKVSFVAHSLGGLVARAYFARYGIDRVDWFITLGSPHRGMLKTFRALTEGIRVMGFFGPAGIREASRTFPSAYELLPQDPATGMVNLDPFLNNAWADSEMLPHLQRAASTIATLLPLQVPEKSCFIYGTDLETLTSARVGTSNVTFDPDQRDGDQTVPRVSAMGQGLVSSGAIARFPVPFGVHSNLPDDEVVRQRIISPRLLEQSLPDPLLIARYQEGTVARPRSQNLLRVEVLDNLGQAIPGVHVNLRVPGVPIRPLAVDAHGGHRLQVTMSGPGSVSVHRIEAHVPGRSEPLRESITLHT
ncbi:MAG: hypothetical protein SF066_01510 [Thermoanaerobaculia bacterium]|nr:hypothetical protein [Thermoanaerobaculia bacterium]